MKYLIVIVCHGYVENLIFAAVRTWIQDVPSDTNVYVYGSKKNYGFKHAMLERARNLVFVDDTIPTNGEDHLVLVRPGQYLSYDKLSKGHSQIFDRETYERIGIDTLLKSHLRGENFGPIKSLCTVNAILNYHVYKDNWEVYSFLSKFNQIVIPNFPVFATSIKISNHDDLPSLINTLINEPPSPKNIDSSISICY